MNTLVVLDGYTLNPGDLSWDAWRRFGALTLYDRTPDELIIKRAENADWLLTNKTPLTAETLAKLPKLKYIGVLATGVNVVDVEAAKARGIIVTNVPSYGPDSVAQMTMAHLLHHCNRVALHDTAVHQGQWQGDFSFTLAPLTALSNKVMGLVGYGAIAQSVATMAEAFGMQVVIHTPNEKHELPNGRQWLPLAQLLAQSDVVSLHCPLTAQNSQFINAQTLAKMKSTAMLINTARGGLVDEVALAKALELGQLAGAGLDVLSEEPPAPDNPLLAAPNCSITPHNAWATVDARARLMAIAEQNLVAFIEGKDCHRV